MSELPRLVLVHIGGGFAVAAVFVGALLMADTGGLGALVAGTAEGPWAALLLWLFSGMTFGAALGASALASLSGGDARPTPVLVPIRVRSQRRR
ncbi:MAG: hypothetical protein K2X74_22460 [Acetobacteraceae bacterium]|nr:hypothetical protein [Acetobacteraceae bacterium]